MSHRPITRAVPSLALTFVVAAVVLSACASSDTTGTPAGAPSSAAEPAVLSGTSWTLESRVGSDGAQQAAVTEPSVASLTFSQDGKVAGSTGCNRFAGTYTQAGQGLTITPGATTQMACVGPVAAQESGVLAALPEVESFTIESDDLQLRDAAGAVLLVYKPGLSQITGTSWRATGINNGNGAVEANAQTEDVTAAFGDDSVLTGSGGCNDYHATYTLGGGSGLSIGPIASTRKSCEDAVMATEQRYFAALATVASYAFDGNRLTLRDADDATQVSYIQVG